MQDTIRRIHRLRKFEEQTRRRDLLVAENREHENREALQSTEQQVRRSQAQTSDNHVDDMARHHAFALRMEMQRRVQQSQLDHQSRRVSFHREQWNVANREARIVERVAELREEAEMVEQRHVEQRELDSLGMAAWWKSGGNR